MQDAIPLSVFPKILEVMTWGMASPYIQDTQSMTTAVPDAVTIIIPLSAPNVS